MKLVPEIIGPHFTKYHAEILPFACAFHHFTGPELGDPHDHPWDFTTTILSGGYVERVFDRDGQSFLYERKPGDTLFVSASRIHKIERLPNGDCWTLVRPGRPYREVSFYRWVDGVCERRREH